MKSIKTCHPCWFLFYYMGKVTAASIWSSRCLCTNVPKLAGIDSLQVVCESTTSVLTYKNHRLDLHACCQLGCRLSWHFISPKAEDYIYVTNEGILEQDNVKGMSRLKAVCTLSQSLLLMIMRCFFVWHYGGASLCFKKCSLSWKYCIPNVHVHHTPCILYPMYIIPHVH